MSTGPKTTVPAEFTPTDEQQAIVTAAAGLQPGQSMKVLAYAGAGKTSTLRLVSDKSGLGRGLYVAFNRAIVTESQGRFPNSVVCKTLHSVAWRALGMTNDEVSKGFNGHTITTLLGDNGWLPADSCLTRQRGQAAYVAKVITNFCHSADPDIEATLDMHVEAVLKSQVGPETPNAEPNTPASLVNFRRAALRPMLRDNALAAWRQLSNFRNEKVQISHDVYLKIFELNDDLVRTTLSEYRWIALDESQDLNPVMRSIAVKSGRTLIAVGDPWQQIYSWRGAEDALALLPGQVLYLSQSFRFGQAIANVAWRILSSKPSSRPTVRLRGSEKRSVVVEGNTAGVMICRSNAGVMREALTAAKAGSKIHVIGGIDEIAEDLRSALALMEGRKEDVRAESLRRFLTWQDLKDEVEATKDLVLSRLVTEVENSDVLKAIAALERAHVPTERLADVVVTTTHKAKGREWDEVGLGRDFPTREKLRARIHAAEERGNADDARAALEEWHVLYVAATRGIERLILPTALYEDFYL